MKKSLLSTTALAGLMAVSGAANALSVSYTDVIASQGTNYSGTLTFAQFDSSLGTLNSVDFSLAASVTGSAAYESTDGSATTISLDLAALLTLKRPDLSTLVTAFPVANITEAATAYDGVTDYAGTSGSSFTGLSGSLTEVSSSFSAADFALFTGLGTIDLDMSAQGFSTGSGSGNLTTQFSTFADASVTVTYNYSVAAVPVPAAVWLFGSGLIGLVGVARRKQS